jgi:hypothetical protein
LLDFLLLVFVTPSLLPSEVSESSLFSCVMLVMLEDEVAVVWLDMLDGSRERRSLIT